jgi:glutamine amidotransferase
MNKVCILDFGSGNVKSVLNAFNNYADSQVSNSPEAIKSASHIVLPGVGSFKNAMNLIREKLPLEVLIQQLENGKPFLGICVGMQALSLEGIEFESAVGLGLIPGTVSRIENKSLPLPHVGWNNIPLLKEDPITTGISKDDDFYFIHSFAYHDLEDKFILGKTEYGELFPSIVSDQNIYGVQFHPEKSQQAGAKLLSNFVNIK